MTSTTTETAAPRWGTTPDRPKDIRNLDDALITEVRAAMEDGETRYGPASKENHALVRAGGRWLALHHKSKAIRKRERDGVLSWWVADKIIRKNATTPPKKVPAASTNGGQEKASPLQKAAAAVQEKGR